MLSPAIQADVSLRFAFAATRFSRYAALPMLFDAGAAIAIIIAAIVSPCHYYFRRRLAAAITLPYDAMLSISG